MVEPGGKQRSSGKKWLLGCGGGCLTTVVVLAVVAGLVIYYAMRAVPILPPETFLVRNTDGFVVSRITKDDEAIIRELQKVLKRLPEITDMSEQARKNWRQQQANAGEALASAGPVQVVVLQQVTSDGESSGAMVISIRRLSGFFRWTINWSLDSLPAEGGSVEEYEGTTIGTSKDGTSVAARGNNFIFSENTDVIKHWIDRIKKQRTAESKAEEKKAPAPSSQLTGELKKLYETLPQDVPVRFGFRNEDGQLRALIQKSAMMESLKSLEEMGVLGEKVNAVGGELQTESGSTGKVGLKLLCADVPSASEFEGRLEKKKAELEKNLKIEKLKVEREDARLNIEFLVPNMWSRLRRSLMPDSKEQEKQSEGAETDKKKLEQAP